MIRSPEQSRKPFTEPRQWNTGQYQRSSDEFQSGCGHDPDSIRLKRTVSSTLTVPCQFSPPYILQRNPDASQPVSTILPVRYVLVRRAVAKAASSIWKNRSDGRCILSETALNFSERQRIRNIGSPVVFPAILIQDSQGAGGATGSEEPPLFMSSGFSATAEISVLGMIKLTLTVFPSLRPPRLSRVL